MAGSRKNKSSANASKSKAKEPFHVFLDRPNISGVDLNQRIDVAAYWIIRSHLRIARPLWISYFANCIKVGFEQKLEPDDLRILPFISIRFSDQEIDFVSVDGSAVRDSVDEVGYQKLEYADPNFPEKTVEIVRSWFQRVRSVGQFVKACEDPLRVIYARE